MFGMHRLYSLIGMYWMLMTDRVFNCMPQNCLKTDIETSK